MAEASFSAPRLPSQATRRPNAFECRKCFDPFAQSNSSNEIETVEEFLSLEQAVFTGFVFQEVHFTELPADRPFESFSFAQCTFLGCEFPEKDVPRRLRENGGNMIMDNLPSLPFKPFRAFLYTQAELAKMDKEAYAYYKKSKNALSDNLYFHLHDFSIHDALYDYAEGKTFISIMGGHAAKRQDDMYSKVSHLSRTLSQAGFVMASGGGPGAMEATNLGAFMYNRSDEEFEEALKIISADPSSVEPQFKDVKPAKNVVDRFGPVRSNVPSLGIPTYFFGHEPSNLFSGMHAKFFGNATREEVLLDICHGGLILTPGGPGTMQELFQAGCTVAYADKEMKYPIVFFGEDFWRENGMYDVFLKQASNFDHADMVFITDDVCKVVEILIESADRRNLYRLRNIEQELSNPYWHSRGNNE